MEEIFLYKRKEKSDIKLNMIFAYPAIESFAMASLGYLSIFKMFDLAPNVRIDRLYQDTKNPSYPPKNADAIGFSISFELDFLNLIKMLNKYDIPLKSSKRSEKDPLIYAGGPVLMSNPIAYQDFFDFISIGEKVSLIEVVEVLKNKNEKSKDEILKELSNVEGIFVPKYPKKTTIARDNLNDEVLYTPILSKKSFFKDTFIIELERGCPKMCNFCLASWLNLPARFAPFEKIKEAIDIGIGYSSKIALLGAYVAGHPDFKKIINYILQKNETKPIELSISSLRADLADIDLIKALVKLGQKSVTIALEAASQRLRNLINKDLSEEQFLKTVEIAHIGGLKGIKIYAMISLPTEQDCDIEEFVNLFKKIKEGIKKRQKEGYHPFNVTLSVSTFIPKIQTPFENQKRADKKTIEKRINYLKKNFHKLGFDFRCSSVDWDIVQTFLSTSKNSLADFLIDVVEDGGNLSAFKRNIKKYNFQNDNDIDFDFIQTGANDLKQKIKNSFTF